MAVVIARLAIGVAAIGIEAAPVREHGASRRKRQDKHDDEGKMHGSPCNPTTWHSPVHDDDPDPAPLLQTRSTDASAWVIFHFLSLVFDSKESRST